MFRKPERVKCIGFRVCRDGWVGRKDICGQGGTGPEEVTGVRWQIGRRVERQGESAGKLPRRRKSAGEMARILRIFGFHAFWPLLRRVPDSVGELGWRIERPTNRQTDRPTDVRGYSGRYVCPSETSLSPKVLSDRR